jgi:hypothetical protein
MARSGEGRTRRRRFRVEARCAWCGVIPLEADDLAVHAGHEGERGGLLEFSCPSCDRLNLRRLAAHEVELLAGVGIGPMDQAERPAPLELLEIRSGPPITWDDLLDFHQELAGADDVATFSAPGEGRDMVPTSTIANERHAA